MSWKISLSGNYQQVIEQLDKSELNSPELPDYAQPEFGKLKEVVKAIAQLGPVSNAGPAVQFSINGSGMVGSNHQFQGQISFSGYLPSE